MTKPSPDPRVPASAKKKILLISSSGSRRNLRENVLRKHGLEVVCASHISDARLLWHPAAYSLVLFDLQHDAATATEFCHEIKESDPRQRIAFLVGKPDFLASAPGPVGFAGMLASPTHSEEILRGLMATACEALPQRGGFLEAVWRMSLARSAAVPARVSNMPAENGSSFLAVAAVSPPAETAASLSFGAAVRRAQVTQKRDD
jgi:CheY-like chemotaxis protein